jgi:N-methylhydantoinase A/oxoprolinase/acetone carboxylase beta subunit
VVPLCQLAVDEPQLVHSMLDLQLINQYPGDIDGIALVCEHYERRLASLEGVERSVLEAMGGRVAVASKVLTTLQLRRVMERLVQRGVLQIAAFTPTDASHVVGLQHTYDVEAARKAATLFARGRDRQGKAIAPDADTLAAATIDTLVRRSAEAVLAAAFDHDGLPSDTVNDRVVQAVLDHRLSTVRLPLGLDSPLVGLGASAPAYYPRVAATLGAESRIPAHADVANAVGAVVGRVRITAESVVSSPTQGQFVVHSPDGPSMFTDLEAARAFALRHLTAAITADMESAGAPLFELDERWHPTTVVVEGLEMFVEGRLTLVASGRPAHGD